MLPVRTDPVFSPSQNDESTASIITITVQMTTPVSPTFHFFLPCPLTFLDSYLFIYLFLRMHLRLCLRGDQWKQWP